MPECCAGYYGAPCHPCPGPFGNACYGNGKVLYIWIQINVVSVRGLLSLRACLHGGGGPQIGEVACGGSPHLSCKRDQIRMRDYMDR